MALILDGNGLIQGLDAGGLPSGSVNADSLASTLDLSSKTMTFGNVSASGITFPATQSASSNANTLDDYEEGTWTPSVTPSSGTLTAYTSSGNYRKIGGFVWVSFHLVLTSPGTAGGNMTIGNFPFVSTQTSNLPTLVRETQATGYIYQFLMAGTVSGLILTTTNGVPLWTTNYGYAAFLCYPAA